MDSTIQPVIDLSAYTLDEVDWEFDFDGEEENGYYVIDLTSEDEEDTAPPI